MKTVRVRKANGERVVPAEKAHEYLEMGFSILDDKGNVVERPAPTTIPEFRQQVAELKAEIRERDEIIEKLTAQIEQLTASDKVENTAEETVEMNDGGNSSPDELNAEKAASKAKNRKTAAKAK